MDISGTRSEENVRLAFAGESQARNKYTYFALQARNEGLTKVADLFEEMARNEMEHAKIWFKLLNNGLGESMENLMAAAESEREEWESLYPSFAQTARDEGFELLAIMFDNIAAIEKSHENRFLEMLAEIQGEKNKSSAVVEISPPVYICSRCGYKQETAMHKCPVCGEQLT